MTDRTLNAAQVASLLVSISCGIGYLLGTGELAVQQGMASCLYALATALRLTVLAFCAPLLWTAGQSVWNWFAQLYGPSVTSLVALLSLVWMTEVLAAQIRGASSLLALTAVSPNFALPLIGLLLVGLSLTRLSWLSAGFALCKFACNLLLVHSLIETGGLATFFMPLFDLSMLFGFFVLLIADTSGHPLWRWLYARLTTSNFRLRPVRHPPLALAPCLRH